MPVALPIELVAYDHAFGRADQAVVGRQKIAGQGLGIRIDQPGLGIKAISFIGLMRTVGLIMIKLTRAHARNKDAPDIAPAIQIRIEIDALPGLAV